MRVNDQEQRGGTEWEGVTRSGRGSIMIGGMGT